MTLPVTKICTKCLIEKTLDAFHKKKGGRLGVRADCAECVSVYFAERYKDTEKAEEYRRRAKQRNADDPERMRDKNLREQRGITLAQYNLMLEEQEGKCAICSCTPVDGEKALSVDHNHKCCPGYKACGVCTRGLLCGRCNMALGLFGDDVEMLRAAIKYLESFDNETEN